MLNRSDSPERRPRGERFWRALAQLSVLLPLCVGAVSLAQQPVIADPDEPGSKKPETTVKQPKPTNPTKGGGTSRHNPGSTSRHGSAARAVVATPAQIISRFLDPRQTDRVTAADWESVDRQTTSARLLNPTSPELKAQQLFAQGQLAYLKGDYVNALIAFNNAARVKPDSALAFYGLGNAYLATEKLDEAAKAYRRALELNRNLALAHRGMSEVLRRQGKDKSARNYQSNAQMLGLAGGSDELGTAKSLMRRHRWAQALAVLTPLTQKKPSAGAFMALGECYEAMHKPLSASQSYRSATELDQNSAIAAMKYGEMMFELHEYNAAKEALGHALTLDGAGVTINSKRARKLADEAAKRSARMK